MFNPIDAVFFYFLKESKAKIVDHYFKHSHVHCMRGIYNATAEYHWIYLPIFHPQMFDYNGKI